MIQPKPKPNPMNKEKTDMMREKIKEWLDCNGLEDLTSKDGVDYYSEDTMLNIILHLLKNKSHLVNDNRTVCHSCKEDIADYFVPKIEDLKCPECGETWYKLKK